ncbi:MAG TPA: hypothetical protein VE267_11000 [Bradyrhizobium sp.]|nr:hypothetical protein [Bradyrhizobium sp.]
MQLPDDPKARVAVVGVEMFGRQWKTPLAGASDVSFATIKNWAAGKPAPRLDCHLLDAVEQELDRDGQRNVVLRALRAALRERLSRSKPATMTGERRRRVPATNRRIAEAECTIETRIPKMSYRRLTVADLNYLDPQVRAIAAEFLELTSAKPRK